MPAQPAVQFVGRAKTWSEAKLQCNKAVVKRAMRPTDGCQKQPTQLSWRTVSTRHHHTSL